MENEQDMPFQSERGFALDYSINVQYDFETQTLKLFLNFFSF
jgi:hypothetical protein